MKLDSKSNINEESVNTGVSEPTDNGEGRSYPQVKHTMYASHALCYATYVSHLADVEVRDFVIRSSVVSSWAWLVTMFRRQKNVD